MKVFSFLLILSISQVTLSQDGEQPLATIELLTQAENYPTDYSGRTVTLP